MRDPQLEETQRAWVSTLVGQAQAGEFYGTITLKFESGKLKHAEKIQNLKPPQAVEVLPTKARS